MESLKGRQVTEVIWVESTVTSTLTAWLPSVRVHTRQIGNAGRSGSGGALRLPARSEHDEKKGDEKKPQSDKDSSINNLFHAEYDNFCF